MDAENLFTFRDPGILVDQPAEAIEPYHPYAGRWNRLRDGSQR